ncbi:6,7-dimethyl-8-ribityllumazine synthase [Paraflavisolibacter sp. H34]|uniref:6,7-dimethyl-8-ribityllumazine synthase n=1 Tax=Huijunlia imazamoxiresistens TaxID=3127457 RepID=UPI003016A41C
MASLGNKNLLQQIEGIQNIKDALVVLVKTEWNAAVVDELESGCIRIFEQYGLRYRTLTVPGAVEIPFAIQQTWANTNQPSAFIALGCVIKGDTPHFDYVCQSITDGVTQLNLALPVPTIFGVLTVNTDQQAQERIGGVHGHKGEEAAITAIKMIQLNQGLKSL